MQEKSLKFKRKPKNFKTNEPIAKTCGGNSPKDFPLYCLIVLEVYNSLISLYGLTAIKILATYVWAKKNTIEKKKII